MNYETEETSITKELKWDHSRFRLVSLMELLRLKADAFCRAMAKIGQTAAYLEIPPQFAEPTVEQWGSLGSALREIEQELEKLELRFSLNQVSRIKGLINRSRVPNHTMRAELAQLAERIVEELETAVFLSVPFVKVKYYDQKDPLFGLEVEKKFPKLTEDISEAGKCFALHRYTATVFHLMRVLEAALQEFGKTLGVALVTQKVWQNILDEVNKVVKGLEPRKDPRAKAYAEAAAHLYNVKVAWRNEVMHPKETYTEEEAESILQNVKTFMVDLAELL